MEISKGSENHLNKSKLFTTLCIYSQRFQWLIANGLMQYALRISMEQRMEETFNKSTNKNYHAIEKL